MADTEKKYKEPFVHLTKRKTISTGYKVLIKACAVTLAALIIILIAKLTTKESLGSIFKFVKSGAFGSSFSIEETFKDVAILLGISIALAPAFKMRFWNIGAQGQVLFGTLCAGMIAFYFGAKITNQYLLLLIMFVCAVLGGGIWAIIPAFFKVKLNANETLFTLMMNYIAIQLILCFMDIWKGKDSALKTFDFGHLPNVIGSKYGFTYIVVAILTVVMFVYLARTKHGYEITVVGESINTARYAGINTSKVMLRTLFLSGMLCGLCGFFYVGNVHSISTIADGGYGFTAIIVAWAAHFNPFIMSLISFAIVLLQKGGVGIVNNCTNLNEAIGSIFVGVFLFILIGSEFFINYKLNFNRDYFSSKKKDKEDESKKEVNANV